ncbi:ABC transporter ATP-binding protein [Romboutsia timonensis]|uniref:ABC transporter ATP-binding protein n=1 Tax=Romboutsia timonensis TaxID=1776391 RepID=UPI002A7F978D|nr:ABC transporter ATP-binding protein [Romboutsia timonensis]MCI6666742.1 ABC transporter ATP-binding protein [Romboutsia timonensis]MDY3960234.1 ABC transporter ATP-binding protein [Romboutsia timonensis]
MINVSLKNVTKEYRKKIVLNNINLTIESHSLNIILGKSGAGKSTLLNLIGLLDNPTHGEIIIKDNEIKGLNSNQISDLRMNHIGFVFQSFYLNPKLKAYENVMIPMYINNIYKNEDLEKKAKSLLKIFDLEEKFDHLSNELSGGEQQRVAIARAIANNPSIIIADEPTGNLDKENEELVLNLFKKLSKEGKSVIIVTHNEYLTKYADNVFYLSDGNLEEVR